MRDEGVHEVWGKVWALLVGGGKGNNRGPQWVLGEHGVRQTLSLGAQRSTD